MALSRLWHVRSPCGIDMPHAPRLLAGSPEVQRACRPAHALTTPRRLQCLPAGRPVPPVNHGHIEAARLAGPNPNPNPNPYPYPNPNPNPNPNPGEGRVSAFLKAAKPAGHTDAEPARGQSSARLTSSPSARLSSTLTRDSVGRPLTAREQTGSTPRDKRRRPRMKFH